ncbi:RagB/SusD family nutrient uptake outer membrane protein [Ferruginibacter lapsinanis]|uniref:RagB/SusD family nutrient uptake outer membrane protein n=1 Tax=Ferruginibacter lapsinanis TaxID=563172 RepID=UPI001E4DFCC6|nr:RagB/SusD family nutrient uptake outer membrane protein [Ferruginibacter lapsinanis]UEG50624.1 RagB/SusD family nutrient uptake outer membrane protein [Ferruginibacter lapsinanis]
MKNNILKSVVALSLVIAISSGCTKLDLRPTNDKLADDIYKTALGYRSAFAKVYSSMQNTGNTGGSGSRDISQEVISDEGNSDFLRMFWYLQCLSTDEAGWTYYKDTDPLGIHQMSWSASNATVAGLFYRSYFQITLCNDFIRQSSDAKLAERGITGTDADNIRMYKQEARFLRAYQYWVLMDLFGSVPFATEANAIGAGLPSQISRKDLFAYVVSELKDLSTLLKAPRTNEYGRVDRAAAWALLSRAYLNAEVYKDTVDVHLYDSCIVYSKKVIDEGGYSLHNNYKELMLADNNRLTNEFIYAIPYDGTYGQNYGGTTFLVHGPAGVEKEVSGTNGSWNCIRITQQFVSLFDSKDIRGQFYDGKVKEPDPSTGKVDSQLINMTVLLGESKYGYSSFKFRNTTTETLNDPTPIIGTGKWINVGGKAPHADPAGNFSDVDFPLFRLAEVYLNFAEAVVRRGSSGPDNTVALDYLNQLSKRARPSDPNGNTISELTLPYILAERGREMMWECCRRTDLIRFKKFTSGDYLWAWKGGVVNGTGVDSKYNLYPIPATELSSNPNIKQTVQGY